MKKIVFFGDSITEAYKDISNPLDLGKGYIDFLSKTFRNIKFYNRGIGGQKIKNLLNRVQQDVVNTHPDICFIWIGVNDAWLPHLLHQPSSLNSFLNDYKLLIEHIKSKLPHTKIVLIKPYAILSEKVTVSILNDLSIYRNDCDKIGLAYELEVIDIKSHIEKQLLTSESNELFYDGIHPTLLGYEQISNVLKNFIKGHKYDL